MTAIAPVRRQVVVPARPEAAFAIWTAEIGKWWPLDRGHSVYGAGGTVAFVHGQLVEESAEGRTVWGTVLDWNPPDFFRMTWHPGRGPDVVTEVSVRFAAVGDGAQTLVTLEHSGWERLPDPLGARSEYANGWIGVVDDYVGFSDAVAPPDSAGEVWLVLRHSPGINAPADGNVFAHPDFMEHAKFAQRLTDSGVVVGAGPLPGRTGHGMTILRVPAAQAADYVRRAQQEDQSVVRGLLQVDARPWAVRMVS